MATGLPQEVEGLFGGFALFGQRFLCGKFPDALDRFLHSTDTGAKLQGHYRRCAVQILKGLLISLQRAEKQFNDLRQTSLAKMSVVDKARYEKAQKHFEDLADGEAGKAAEFPTA